MENSNEREDNHMGTEPLENEMVDIKEIFVQRISGNHRPMKGQELHDEAIRLLEELKAKGYIEE